MTIQLNTKFVEAEKSSPPDLDQDLVPAALDSNVLQALHHRTQKEAMAMTSSLAKQMAKDAWQAELDTYRVCQAQRVGAETLHLSAEAIVRINDYAKNLAAKYRVIETDIWEMAQGQFDIIKQEPRIAHIGYLRRYHNL